MKIYRATDNYKVKFRWCATKEKANWWASLWASILEIEEGLNDAEKWCGVDTFNNKSELLDQLNINASS